LLAKKGGRTVASEVEDKFMALRVGDTHDERQ
jgi:hypothetical protein